MHSIKVCRGCEVGGFGIAVVRVEAKGFASVDFVLRISLVLKWQR